MILYRGYKLKDWIMKAIKAVMRYESSILQFSNRDWERIKYISRSKIFLEYIYRENEKLIIIRSSTGKVNKINSSNYSQFVVTLPLLVISQSWIARNSANLGTGEVSLRIETRKSWTWRNDRVPPATSGPRILALTCLMQRMARIRARCNRGCIA